MKIKIIAVGKLSEPYKRLEREFVKRIQGAAGLQVHEIKEVKEKNENQKKAREARLIEKAVDASDTVILMAKEGRQFQSSEQFASCLRSLNQPAFVIGSDVGLDKSLEKRASHSFSFSGLTFPHQLFRIMLYEQIYRAQCIWINHPYHK